ncbi:MAG TPA: CheR family methyltransferase, partial [Labilithrix sp.]
MTDQEDDSAIDPHAEPVDPEGLEALLEFLKRERGFDFSGYKRTSISRRIAKRMTSVGASTYAAYIEYLEVHPDEFPRLFDMMLINVTAFFRDTAAWEALAEHMRGIFAAKKPDDTIRVWSAGCASGEEAYTLAILVAEILGVESCGKRVKIYATDLDEDALNTARQATYSAKSVENVPPALLEKYFTRSGSGFVFHRDLRRCVIFGRHDLVQDAPISRVDLLSCRNTLMYFNAETQGMVLRRLHFAVAPEGLLFLGKAEMLLTHGDLFTPVDLKLRIFRRAQHGRRAQDGAMLVDAAAALAERAEERAVRLHDTAFELAPIALVVIDLNGRIALANKRASHLFGLTPLDIGRPFQDLELSYRPAELRSCIDQARSEHRVIALRAVERGGLVGDKTFLDIEVLPLAAEDGSILGVQVAFADVTTQQRMQAELRRASTELEAAHEELQSTSEELETTNEELQSTVEELETTNEELHSTNEELETMNEELQSTNEELQTINDELRQRSTDFNRANEFLGTVLSSMRAGVAVLDPDMLVTAWTGQMEELWGLRAEEV